MNNKRMVWNFNERARLKAPAVCLNDQPVPVFGSNEMDQVRSLIQPGDNLLSVFWPTGRVYNRIYGYYFTHAAQCISSTGLVEALNQGVVPTNNERYTDSTFAVTRWKGITPEQQQFISNAAKEHIGEPYDWSELSWFIARGAFYLAAGPALLLGKLGLAFAFRGLAALMNKRNLLDRRQAVICSRVLADDARRANTAGLLPHLPVDKLGAGKGCLAPAHFANSLCLDWVLIKSKDKAPV